jgi:hypothetical protein
VTDRLDERAFRYVHCDIPAGMTIAQWRAARTKTRERKPSIRQIARRHIAAATVYVRARRLWAPHHRRAASA